MTTIAHCPTCFRREQWHEGELTVIQPGGHRHPAGSTAVAAWDTIQRARTQGLPVVGTCVCGQPLLGEQGAHWTNYTLVLPHRSIVIGADHFLADGENIDEDTIEAALMPLRHPHRVHPGQALFQVVALTAMLAPVLLWFLTATTVGLMIMGLASPAGYSK